MWWILVETGSSMGSLLYDLALVPTCATGGISFTASSCIKTVAFNK